MAFCLDVNSFPITFVEFIVSSVSDSNYCKGRFFPRIIGLYNYFFFAQISQFTAFFLPLRLKVNTNEYENWNLDFGGDCPGINATIRGVCKTVINHYGMEVFGIHSGFRGLVDNDVVPLTEASLTGLLNMGGTIFGNVA